MYSIFAGIVVVTQTRSHLITALPARVVFPEAHCLTRLVNFVGLNALTRPSFSVLRCFRSILELYTLLGYKLFC
jgi:hypothetical protein